VRCVCDLLLDAMTESETEAKRIGAALDSIKIGTTSSKNWSS
jgi:hypothetical protein